MRFAAFFLIVSTVLALAYAYVGWRVIVPAGLTRAWTVAAWAFLLVLFLLPVITFALQFTRSLPGTGGLLVWTGYVALGLFSFVFTFLASAGPRMARVRWRREGMGSDRKARRRLRLKPLGLRPAATRGVVAGDESGDPRPRRRTHRVRPLPGAAPAVGHRGERTDRQPSCAP